MPTPSSAGTSSEQQQQQRRQQQIPQSSSPGSQPSCPEDHLHYPPSYAQVQHEIASAVPNPTDIPDPATVSRASPRTVAPAYRYALNPHIPPSPPRIPLLSSPEMPSDVSDIRSPSYTPISPAGEHGFGRSLGSSRSASRSTTASPQPHSAHSVSGESNAATSPTPNDDEDLKPMDIEDSAAGPSRPRGAASWIDPGLADGCDDFMRDEECDADVVMETDWTNYSHESPAVTHDFTSIRVIPTSPSSYLRPGSRFKGTQTSERSVYKVDVEIKHVDMRESFLCGYLHIEGLTPDNPSICTYFEGEIIGPKYGFMTKHKSWGADEATDLSHWSKFAPFRQYANGMRKNVAKDVQDVKDIDFSQKNHIFMRWKEHFLVPDHRKSSIPGASFEGFYYISFNQVDGIVSGIYFHHKSERFQHLELRHVHNQCPFGVGAIEFR